MVDLRPAVTVGDDHYSHLLEGAMTPLKCYQVSVTATAQDLPTLLGEDIPEGAKHVWLDPEAEIRVTFDGQTPTASTIGIRMSSDVLFVNQAGLIAAAKMIASAATPVNIHFFG